MLIYLNIGNRVILKPPGTKLNRYQTSTIWLYKPLAENFRRPQFTCG